MRIAVVAAVAALSLAAGAAESIQSRIDAAAAAGGGRVVVPAGTWETGPIRLRSNVELHLEDGAELVFSGNPDDYRPLVRTCFSCIECMGLSPLVYAAGCTNVAVTGRGTLRPRMETWTKWFNRNTPAMFAAMRQLYAWGENDEPVENRRVADLPNATFRPNFIEFDRCTGVRIEGFAVRESPCWTIHLHICTNAVVRGLDVRARGHNNDGIDITSSKRVLVEDCTFDQGDDAVVIKSGRDRDGRRIGVPCEDVEVRDCTIRGGHTMFAVGSEVSGGVRNVFVHDCRTSDDARVPAVLCVKTSDRKGAFIENVVVSNVVAQEATVAVFRLMTDVDYQWKKYPARETALTRISGIRLEDIRCARAERVYALEGDARLPVKGVTLRNVRVGSVTRGLGTVENVEGFVCEGLVAPVSREYADGVAARTDALAVPVLGDGEGLSCWSAFYNRLFDLDAAADEAWLKVGSAAEFDARRTDLRTKALARLGGFPERTPLNARTTGTVRRNGYRIENVLFESRPGMFVTGNLYLPDSPRFMPPYPAALEVCGHSDNGKNSPTYQRIALLAAKNGLATFVIDPLGQGERRQSPEEDGETPVRNHLRLGVSAMLLGHGFAAFELWDAMRALDYLGTRDDLRHEGFGMMGNSGGGTQSVLMSAFDDRVKATATSCFLCNLREQTMWRLLPDSEQMIFGQLVDGVNHAAYPLLGGNPVLMLARRDDMIPFSGTRATARLIAQVGANIGRPDRYGMFDLPGPHGYTERHMRETSRFLLKRLCGRDDVAFDEAELDVAHHDFGPGERELRVTPTGRVADLEGFRSAYSYLADELEAALKTRQPLAAAERARLVRSLADIDETRVGARVVVSESSLPDGTRVTKAYFPVADGYRIPTVEFTPPDAADAVPLLLAADLSRTNCAELAMENRTRPVCVADVCACGEIGKTRHHYLNPNDDEETAKMLYLLGSSLVGRRAGELVAVGRSLAAHYGRNPTLVTFGRVGVAAAHACAAAPGLFVDYEFHRTPPSWADAVRTRAAIDYAVSVHGALLKYDWPDLVK